MVYCILLFYKGRLIHRKKDEKGYKGVGVQEKMEEISVESVDRKRMGCVAIKPS